METDGSVLDIRPARTGAETNGKRRPAVADLISNNLLELMVMVKTAFLMMEMMEQRRRRRGESVMLMPDNEAAVTWVRSCPGGRWGV